MFFKKDRQLAFATANAGTSPSQIKNRYELTRDTNSAETDDFGAFNTAPSRRSRHNKLKKQAPQQNQNAPKNQGGNNRGTPNKFLSLNRSSILVAAVALAIIILLVSLVVMLVNRSGGDVKYSNNSYISYTDTTGKSTVVYNGRVIGEYEHEVELIVSADRSFAYIIEDVDDGYQVHIANGKKVETATTTPVAKIIDTASRVPGLVWLELDGGIYYYTLAHGDERVVKDYSDIVEDPSAEGAYNYMVHISDDASTVVYAQTDSDSGQIYLYTYKESVATRSSAKGLRPVDISADGSFIYAYGVSSKDGVTKVLYVVSGDDKFMVDEGLRSIVALNASGDELVYTLNTDAGVYTYIFAFNPKRIGAASSVKIGEGTCVPVIIDPEISVLETYKRSYFQRVDGNEETGSPTYFINRKYKSSSICSFSGTFSPDGDYFYYINKSETLQRIDLSDKNHTPKKIAEDIVDFEITKKGNVYWLNDSGRLSFYNTAKEKTSRIADDAQSITLRSYSNTLYFTMVESTEVYTTTEGSEQATAKFAGESMIGIPAFVNSDAKRSYAIFWDNANNSFRIYYTATGRSFKFIASCANISGLGIEDIFNNPTAPASNLVG